MDIPSFGKTMPSTYGIRRNRFFWWSNVMLYITRLNQLTMDTAVKPAFRKIFHTGVVSDDFFSVFIREGDKKSEMFLHTPSDHVHWVLERTKLGMATELYVESDSAKAIREVQELFNGSAYVKVLTLESMRGKEGLAYMGKSGTVDAVFDTDDAVHFVRSILASAHVAMQAKYMAGQLGSNWCRYLHEMHDAGGLHSFQYRQIGWCTKISWEWCKGD